MSDSPTPDENTAPVTVVYAIWDIGGARLDYNVFPTYQLAYEALVTDPFLSVQRHCVDTYPDLHVLESTTDVWD